MTVRFHQTTAFFCTSVLLVLILVWPAAGQAQSRSDTGRHKPKPPPVAVADSLSRTAASGPDARWHLGLSGGVQGGSDLFRVKVINGPAVPWDPATGGGFQSSRFKASLDRNFSFGLSLVGDLSSVWSVRADLGYSRMDVAAEALIGQSGAVFLFDRADILNLGLGLEARLASAPSYPYANASVLISYLGPVRASGLDQTNWGGRLGLGYYHHLNPIWGLRFEARLAQTEFSVGDYVPQASSFTQPELQYDTENHLVFFEFLIGIQLNIVR